MQTGRQGWGKAQDLFLPPPAAAVLVRVGHTKPIPKVGPATDP